jgi:hypothetical protein
MDRLRNCRELLQLAPDTKTVKAIMRDYIQSIAPLIGDLPPACKVAIEHEDDIQAVAVTLLHAELRFGEGDEGRAVLHEIAYTFASAAVRLTMVDGRFTSATA